jgi:hypothetical protein
VHLDHVASSVRKTPARGVRAGAWDVEIII